MPGRMLGLARRTLQNSKMGTSIERNTARFLPDNAYAICPPRAARHPHAYKSEHGAVVAWLDWGEEEPAGTNQPGLVSL